MRAATDAPAQLVELGEPEPFRVLDDHDAGVRHVDPDFDNRRRDEHVQLTRDERVHHPLLRVGLHASVQETDAVFRKDFLRQVVGHLRRRLHVDLLRLLDERVNHVDLPARVDLFPHERPHIVPPRLGLRDRFDRQPSWRHIANDGNIEIAVEREGKRPRNRCRGHHQHVGMQPFGRGASRAAARRTGAARR